MTGPILATLGLALTVGLGNVGKFVLRARAAWRAVHPDGAVPLIRAIGQHAQVSDVMRGHLPADPDRRCRIYVGEDGQRGDTLAYQPPAVAPGAAFNTVTVSAALSVLRALLPGAEPLRWSTPAPNGLPGGYPVRIADGTVTLDLPSSTSTEDAVAFNNRISRGDGVERIDDQGTVYFTAACQEAVAALAPSLAEPLRINDLAARAARLDAVLDRR